MSDNVRALERIYDSPRCSVNLTATFFSGGSRRAGRPVLEGSCDEGSVGYIFLCSSSSSVSRLSLVILACDHHHSGIIILSSSLFTVAFARIRSALLLPSTGMHRNYAAEVPANSSENNTLVDETNGSPLERHPPSHLFVFNRKAPITTSLSPEHTEGQPSKLRRQSSRMLSALKSLTNSGK
jgi:hypothetical protein